MSEGWVTQRAEGVGYNNYRVVLFEKGTTIALEQQGVKRKGSNGEWEREELCGERGKGVGWGCKPKRSRPVGGRSVC